MSVLSQFLNSNSGLLVKDPERVPWWVASEDDIGTGLIAGNIAPLNAATAWTALGFAGATAQVTVDDTYATIVNIASGSGVATNFVLPGFTNIGDVATLEVTIDGVMYTVAFTAANATDRIVSGIISTVNGANGDHYLTPWGDSAQVSGLATRLPDGAAAGTHGIVSPGNTLAGCPCIRFDSSFLVRMKVDDFSAATFRDYGAVAYMLDQ